MFDGRKTGLFWKGLIIFGVSITVLFYFIWSHIYTYLSNPGSVRGILGIIVPLLFGSVVFMFIGLYMMKSGVVEEESAS